MKKLEGVKIGKYELKGFSYVNIPFSADYAIVKKENEDCFRILRENGKFSDPILEIFQVGQSGLTLVKDADPEQPYRFIDSAGFFSERYADVSTIETTTTIKENGETIRTDRSGQEILNNEICKKTKVKKTKDAKWTSITKEFFALPYMGMDKERLYFYCTEEYERDFMLHNLNGRYFLNENFRTSIRAYWEKEMKKILKERESLYCSASRTRQKEIERSDEFYLESDIDKFMEQIDLRIRARMKEAKAKIKKSLEKNIVLMEDSIQVENALILTKDSK